ncbi:MAG TPA: GNAT family N-acetyltransferase [Rhabdochlamydiaceae bacterium]|nr:GNAT family N-acetyltransferase [Rhabdochlamydiaceae bacterium]HSX38584.1 GNAT family N-acetyltransferase [Chlamydiales bacterium]
MNLQNKCYTTGKFFRGESDTTYWIAYDKKTPFAFLITSPIRAFSIFIKDQKGTIFGGASGTLFYGSLYVDSLWIDKTLRHQGWGTKLLSEAESMGRKYGASFVTLNTMDWEALPFYQKLGYSIEFIRKGYEKESKMFMLRKNL